MLFHLHIYPVLIPMLPKGGAPINDEQIAAIAAYVWSISHD